MGKFNSTLINMSSKSVGKYKNNWDKHLPYVLFVYCLVMQDSTKSSPFYLFYGQHPQVQTDLALDHIHTMYQIDLLTMQKSGETETKAYGCPGCQVNHKATAAA